MCQRESEGNPGPTAPTFSIWMSFIRYCIRQWHGHKCCRCYSMTCLYLLNACWLMSINLLYAHCNCVFEMQLVLVLLHVQSQHLGFGSSCAVPLPTILAVFVDHCAKKLEVDEQGVGRMVGDEIGELLRWIMGWSRRRARPSDTPAGHWSKPSLTWGFLMKVQQCSSCSSHRNSTSQVWSWFILTLGTLEHCLLRRARARPGLQDVTWGCLFDFICTCIDPISRSRSYCIVLDLTHPYTIFPQSARMLVSKLVGTWIFVLLWGALHGPNCPESLTA